MKIQKTIITVLAAAAFVVAGCSKQSVEMAVDDTKAAVASVDTTRIEAAFASADAATKAALEPVIAAVKNADYAGAVKELKSLAEKFKLTEEQQAAVNDLVAKAQKAISDAAGKVAGEAGKAVTDLTKSIGK